MPQININHISEMGVRQTIKTAVDAGTGEIDVLTETVVTIKIRDIDIDDYEVLKDLMGTMDKRAAIGSRQGVLDLFPVANAVP